MPKRLRPAKGKGTSRTNTSGTSPRHLAVEKRRAEALQMRADGYNYFAIATALKTSTGRAYDLVDEALAALVIPKAENLRKIMIERLELAMQGLATRVAQGDDVAIGTLIRVMDQFEKYARVQLERPELPAPEGPRGETLPVPVGRVDHGGVIRLEFVEPHKTIDLEANPVNGANGANGHG